MRLKEESDELIQLEKLFTMYQFESVEYFGVKDPINMSGFQRISSQSTKMFNF